MVGRLCCLAIPCLALAAPASSADWVDPERALYLAYRARAEAMVAEAEASEPAAGPGQPTGCLLLGGGSDGASPRQCLGCHGGSIRQHASHPVEVDYEAGGRGNSGMGSLRPLAEAVRRGAFLPDGKVRCVSCHSGRSRWRSRLAIPADAEVRPAVHPGDARTYDGAFPPGVPAAAGFSARQRAAMLPDGFEVGAKPLCLSCHPMD